MLRVYIYAFDCCYEQYTIIMHDGAVYLLLDVMTARDSPCRLLLLMYTLVRAVQ